MNAFPVGTVCIVIGADRTPEMIGEEVVITGAPQKRYGPKGHTWMGYSTDKVTAGGYHYSPKHEFLRRKQPPQTFTGETRIIELFNVTPVPQKVAA